MSASDASADRREQILGEVAEGLYAVFKEAQRRTLDAEDNDEFIRLSAALSKLGRGLRQSLALHARFEKQRREGGSEPLEAPAQPTAPPAPPAPPADPQRQAIARRKAFVTRGVERCVWSEYDDDDADEEATAYSLLRDLEDRLDDLARDDAFLTADVDILIAQFCRELGVDPPERPIRTQLKATLLGDEGGARAAPQANGHDLPIPDSS